MERIAPLAKILAEANGIEWQTLHGTGAGGQIVEQDILDYLSRVMSGEAEPPSTPVDAPPPDWNGEDLPGGGMFDASALSRAGVESDIAEFVSQGRPAGPQVPGTGTPALATDDFELDDAPESDLLAPPAPAQPAPTVIPQPAQTEAAQPQPAPHAAPLAAAPEVAAPAAAAAPSAAGGLGSLLSRLYHKDAEKAKVMPAASAPAPVAAAPLNPAPVTPPPVQPAPVEVTPPTPVVGPVAAPLAPAPVAPAPVAEVAPVTPAVPAQDLPRIEISSPASAQPVAHAEPRHTAPVRAEQAHTQPTEDRIAVPVAPAASPAPTEVPAATGTAPAVPRDAVWFGTYLRRTADVAALSDLRGQLSEALERDVPLSLLVARAAQRHAEALGLSSVAMQDVPAAVARPVSGAGVREALGSLEHTFEDRPDLLVVDAGTLDLDDLHYPHTLTLSVGRVEGGKASLSLQGDVEQARAAQFLASVAQTLEKPVILIV